MTSSERTDRAELPLGVAVVGAGYWGPNLARNFNASPHCDLRWICDLDLDRAAKVARSSGARATTSLAEVLEDPGVEAVAVATPAATHSAIGSRCLEAGRHLLVEKPLASSLAEGVELAALAAAKGLTLMCDHTYCYTPVVRKIREIIADGTLGTIQYVDSVRINLGLLQPDVDVLWDLAPHDLSVLDFVLPKENAVQGVSAHGADPVGAGRASVAYLTLPLGGGALAHLHVNWLSPTKVRKMIIGGSRRMLVWDDLDVGRRLSLYDKGVQLSDATDADARRSKLISYRTGDVVSPALPETEALGTMVAEFRAAVRERRVAATDGASGVRVLELLELASASLAGSGRLLPVPQLGRVAAEP